MYSPKFFVHFRPVELRSSNNADTKLVMQLDRRIGVAELLEEEAGEQHPGAPDDEPPPPPQQSEDCEADPQQHDPSLLSTREAEAFGTTGSGDGGCDVGC